MLDACKTEFYLGIKHCGAAVPVWRVEAVEVTVLLYAIYWLGVSSCSAGILKPEGQVCLVAFCVSIYRLNLSGLCDCARLYLFIA